MFQLIYFWVFMVCGFNVCLCFEGAWLSFHNELKDANREELVVTNITTDENFKLAYKVTKWTSLSFGPTCYSVGLMEKGIVLLVSTLRDDGSHFDIKTQIKDLDEKPLEVVLMTNRRKGDTRIIMILAFYKKLQLEWYEIHKDGKVDIFWSIPLLQSVIHVNVFQMKEKKVLLLANNVSTVDLYEFDLLKNIHWSLQHIPLTTPADYSIVNSFEYDYFLSVPQKAKNVLQIFKFEENHFVPYKNLTSQRLNSVASFDIGFKSFLAIDGLNAGIYQFTRNGLAKEEIINSHLEGVSYWLPVPVTTYRDEVILFAQRVLDHSSHEAIVIDIITYNGGRFEEHEDIPCSYFGEHQALLECLSYDEGIRGSSYIAVDDKVALIVPAPTDVNLLFSIHSTMRHLPNPLKNVIDKSLQLKETLQKMIVDQRKEYEELENLYKQPPKVIVSSPSKKETNNTLLGMNQRRDILQVNETLEEVEQKINEMKEKLKKIVDKESRTEFNTVTINDRLEVNGDSKFGEVEVETIKGSPATKLMEDVVRRDTLKPITGAKTFTDLVVDKVSFEKVNDVDASEIVFKDQIIDLNGHVAFKEPVDIKSVHTNTGKINGIVLEDDIVDLQKKQGALEFEKVNITGHFQAQKINNLDIPYDKIDATNGGADLDGEFDSIFIPENVTVVNINGDNFEDIISRLCLLNIKCYISGVIKINGNIAVNNGVYTEYLNGLKFPEEYILMDSVQHSNITGKKTFTNSLTAREIRSRGTINDLDTKQLVTLSTNQEVSGKLTFKDIQVTEALNVTGEILGEHINKFLPNPTLNEVDHIKANVNFAHLEVEGNIIIDKYFNGNDFKIVLNDLIYKDDENVTIASTKDFPKGFIVQNNFHVSSNSINNIKIDSIVTKDTDQTLNVTFLKGDVVFENLVLNGTYNEINVIQMDQDLVKLTGEQYISSTLIFNDDIEVNHFEITEKLNDLTPDDYIYADGDREIENDILFEEIEAQDILVEGDVTGNLSEIDFNDFNERYLSYTKEQVIEVPYSIKHSTVDDLKVEYVNGKAYDDLFGSGTLSSSIKNLLDRDQLEIENLYVDGSINIETINGENMDDVLPRNILVDEDGNQRRNLSIQGDVYTDTIDIVKLSEVNWRKYIEHLIFKDEIDPVLESPKIKFTQGITVDKLVETEELNGVPLENVFKKEGDQDISSQVIVKGHVTFKDVEIVKDINGVNISSILNSFSVANGTHVIIKDDVLFSKLPHIHKLKSESFVNDRDLTDVFSNLVFIDEDCVLSGDTKFEDIVHIFGNMAISGRINDIVLSDVVPRMILTTRDTEILGPVTFAKPVSIKQYLTVEGDLLTKTLHNCDLNEWVTNAIFIDRGIMLGNFTLEEAFIKDDLNTDFVNDVDMKRVIPLRSNQYLALLEFEELKVLNDVPVGHLVNGYDLAKEFNRSVMANSDQEIPANVVFQNAVLVRENLNVQSINGKDTSKIVTTDSDQNLTSVFNFTSKCRIDSNLHIHGMLNDVDANAWINDGVKVDSPKVQKVYDDWLVSENFTFDDDVRGECKVGGLDLVSAMKEVDEKRNYKYQMEYAIIDDYKNMCTDVTYLYKSAKEQIYKFKYFEDLQTLVFEDQVQYVHYFQYQDNHYLLVNGYNCTSQLLVFNRTAFSVVGSFETGHISQAISVRGRDGFYLVTNGIDQNTCEIYPLHTNIWSVDADNITLEYNIDPQELLQESLVPGTFYAFGEEGVIEFKITNEDGVKKYRKWVIYEENVAFVPRGLKTGLALRTGSKIIFLDQTDPLIEDDFSGNTESIIIGKFTKVYNTYLPGYHDGDLVVTNVGITSTKRNLLAVATHEETSVRGRLDFIKIYEDPIKGEIFHKVPSYKPSSLVSIEFGQGETLLAFLENEKILQVYEYKGIEGFKHHSSSRIEGSKLFLMTLPVEPYLNERKVLGIVHENKIRTIQSVMVGNKIRNDLKCGL